MGLPANSLWQKHSLKLRYQYQMFEKPTFSCIKNVLSFALYKNNMIRWKLILYTGFQNNLWFRCKVESYSWENFVNLENVIFQLASKVMLQIQQYFVCIKSSISHFSPEHIVKFWSWVLFFVPFVFSIHILYTGLFSPV